MRAILEEIEQCAASNRWYAAITLAMTLPDICATLACGQNARRDGVQSRYKAWCRKHFNDDISLDPDLCWNLRSGIVHSGTFKNQEFHRVAFTLPDSAAVHNILLNVDGVLTYCIDARIFVASMTQAATAWFEINMDSDNVKANMPKLIVRRGDALEPIMIGPVAYVSDLR